MSATLDALRRVQALAQSGLAYSTNPYDIERYHELQAVCAQLMGSGGGLSVPALHQAFAEQLGYATPKMEVRGAVFEDGRVLMVRERADHDRWTLPGGWADVGQSPAESIVKEIHEESGYVARVVKVAAVWDQRAHKQQPPAAFHTWKHFFICTLTGGAPTTSLETSEVAFFSQSDLPHDVSVPRATRAQILRMFEHHAAPELPTDFD